MSVLTKRWAWGLSVVVIVVVAMCLSWRRSDRDRFEIDKAKSEAAHATGDAAALAGASASPGADTNATRRTGVGRAYVNNRSYFAPEGDAEDVVARLRPLAEAGDAQASFLIYMKLLECKRALEEGLDQAELRMYADAQEVKARLDKEARKLRDCESYPEVKEPGAGYWLERAADGGSLVAQLMYGIDSASVVGTRTDMLRSPENIIRYKRKAIVYMERAAATGNVDALMSLGQTYENGVLVPEDSMRAYSYFYAAGMFNPAFTRNFLERLGGKLTREQVELAKQRGTGIFNDCCK
ncbi:MAG: sel1 repeat family protein [Lysobacter sp.]|nr:sel1 repeat family protein [Lysobacter sp.]